MKSSSNTLEATLALEVRVESIIESLRPMIARHGGDVALVEITKKNIVKLDFLGACADCAIADITLNDGLKTAIMLECPEITDVVVV